MQGLLQRGSQDLLPPGTGQDIMVLHYSRGKFRLNIRITQLEEQLWPYHIYFLWWEDPNNTEKSEQLGFALTWKKKREEKTRVKELWERCTDETAQVLWTQNILLLICKSLQSPKRQQQKSSRYLVSISQTDKWHLSLTKHKHVPQARGKMFLKLSTSIHWKNYSTSFPQTAQLLEIGV